MAELIQPLPVFDGQCCIRRLSGTMRPATCNASDQGRRCTRRTHDFVCVQGLLDVLFRMAGQKFPALQRHLWSRHPATRTVDEGSASKARCSSPSWPTDQEAKECCNEDTYSAGTPRITDAFIDFREGLRNALAKLLAALLVTVLFDPVDHDQSPEYMHASGICFQNCIRQEIQARAIDEYNIHGHIRRPRAKTGAMMTDEPIDQSDRAKNDRKPGPPLGDLMYLDDVLRILRKEALVARSVAEDEDEEEEEKEYPKIIVTPAQPKSSDASEKHYQRRLEPLLGVPLPIKSHLPSLKDAAAKLDQVFPWFSSANEIVMDAIALAHMSQRPPQLPNMLLVGPSGCGKTEYARILAELFDTPLSLLPVAGTGDDCGLAATDRRWSTSQPSLPVRRMIATGRADQVICIDEADKSAPLNNHNGSVQGALMQMLSARRDYYDIYVSGPVDLSTVTFIATANDLNRISAPLLDRFIVVECRPPTSVHFDALLDSCASRLMRNMELPEGLFEITPDDRKLIREAWLRLPTPSIRSITKIVEKLVSDQARDLLETRILH